MSIGDLCEVYLSSTSNGNWNNWKEALYNIGKELEEKRHPDHQLFNDAACTLMMNDRPGYWNWLNATIIRLIRGSTSRLEPLPVLPDYDEMSSEDLVEKYESNDDNYSKEDILIELRERYPSLIQLNEAKSNINLREILKSDLFETLGP